MKLFVMAEAILRNWTTFIARKDSMNFGLMWFDYLVIRTKINVQIKNFETEV